MAKEFRVYKFRLYPTPEQKKQMDKTIGCCRFIYNWALEQRNKAYETEKKILSEKELRKMLRGLKEEKTWLKEADTKALEIAIKHNSDAFSNFLDKNKKAKHPVFKKKESKGSYDTQLPHKSKYFDNINEGIIGIPKMSKVKVVAHRFVDVNNVKEYVTISRNTVGEYYISIKVPVDSVPEPTSKPAGDNTIGVDLGVRRLAITNDGTVYGKFKIDRKLIKRKKRLQKQLARKIGSKKGEKESNNHKKLRETIAKIDLKIARQREKHQYEVIKSITDMECDYIAIEDLNVKGMQKKGGKRKKGLNRGIANAAMGEFKTRMKIKATSKGKKVVEIDRWYPSSKTCHKCGYVYRKLKLNQRDWICPDCGSDLDRDVNAAINIKNEFVANSERYLPKCKGEVKSVEGETKQNRKNQSVSSSSAPGESESTTNKSMEQVVYQQDP